MSHPCGSFYFVGFRWGCLAGERLRLVCHGVADDARDRSSKHDSQGQSEVGGKGRHHSTSWFHLGAIWHRRLTPDLIQPTTRSPIAGASPILAMKPQPEQTVAGGETV